MPTDVLLINGVSLPYHVLDKGIQHAKSTGNEIKGVFIYENDDDDDKYRFPSDIELSKADYSHTTAEIQYIPKTYGRPPENEVSERLEGNKYIICK